MCAPPSFFMPEDSTEIITKITLHSLYGTILTHITPLFLDTHTVTNLIILSTYISNSVPFWSKYPLDRENWIAPLVHAWQLNTWKRQCNFTWHYIMEPKTKTREIYTRYFMLKYSKKKIQHDQIAKQTEKLAGNLFE